jgi:hypothetical protein
MVQSAAASKSLVDIMNEEQARSRQRGATIVRDPMGPENTVYILMTKMKKTKTVVDKEIGAIVHGLNAEVREAAKQSKRADVAVKLISLSARLISASVEDLVSTPLCKTIVLEIQALGRSGVGHPAINKLLFHISPLSRVAEANRNIRGIPPQLEPIASSDIPHDPSPELLLSAPASVSVSVSSTSSPDLQRRSLNKDARLSTDGSLQPIASGSLQPAKLLMAKPQRLRSSGMKKIMCRICEEEYLQHQLKEHTAYCVPASKIVCKEQSCANSLAELIEMLRDLKKRRSGKPGFDQAAFQAVYDLAEQIAAIQYGTHEAD